MTRTLLVLGLFCIGWVRATAQAPPDSASATPLPKASKRCVLNTTPPSPAETAYNHKDYGTGEKLFREALATNPDDAVAHEGLVRDLIEQNRVNEAAKEADAWVAAAPASSMAHVALGDVRFRQGRPTDSFLAYVEAGRLDPCNPRVYYGAFRVHQLRGAYATARAGIDQAYALHPTDDEIHTTYIWTRPHKDRMAMLAEYVEHTDQINDEDRGKLKTRLEKESLYKPSDCRMSAGSPRTATIPMQAVLDGPTRFIGWGLDVYFNGKRRRLEIDTGASGITISRGAAVFLGIQREDVVESRGIGDKGKVKTSVAHVASIKIGDLEFTNCPVEILENWSALNTEGLIGADVFSRLLVALDFPRHEIRFEPLPARPEQAKRGEPVEGAGVDEDSEPHDAYVAPEMAKWQRIYRRGHELLIPAGIVDTKRVHEDAAWKNRIFLLDTGSQTNLISTAAAAEVTKLSRDTNVGIHGISGEVEKVYEAGKFSLAFGGLMLNSPQMTAIDLTEISHGTGIEVSGLIGAPALFQVVMHIDYRDNLVWCEYHPPK